MSMDDSKEWRIFMEAMPSNEGGGEALKAGWFGPGESGSDINQYIYWRIPDKHLALVFVKKWEAIDTVRDMWRMGYKAHAEPPITVTF